MAENMSSFFKETRNLLGSWFSPLFNRYISNHSRNLAFRTHLFISYSRTNTVQLYQTINRI